MKHCHRCETTLPIDAFTKAAKRYDGLQTYCRECMKAYRLEHYRGNKEQYAARNKATEARLRAILVEAKDVPCADCGIKYNYYAMQFDHREPADKLYGMSNMHKLGSEKKLRAELAKCDVVCGNCHAERTHGPVLKRNGLTPGGKSARVGNADDPTDRDTVSKTV